mmetsp:Transcript_168194/g.540351  ORF Transcript_168194/g.540351 Transcript_168194/m.540351 type:complete len:267 (+) Transcript_168194:1989-2789(+)
MRRRQLLRRVRRRCCHQQHPSFGWHRRGQGLGVGRLGPLRRHVRPARAPRGGDERSAVRRPQGPGYRAVGRPAALRSPDAKSRGRGARRSHESIPRGLHLADALAVSPVRRPPGALRSLHTHRGVCLEQHDGQVLAACLQSAHCDPLASPHRPLRGRGRGRGHGRDAHREARAEVAREPPRYADEARAHGRLLRTLRRLAYPCLARRPRHTWLLEPCSRGRCALADATAAVDADWFSCEPEEQQGRHVGALGVVRRVIALLDARGW